MSFLTDFELGLVINFAVFVATLVFSTKIKDWFTGVPSSLRADLTKVETGIKSDVAKYQADLVAKIVPTPAPVAKPPVAPAPPPAPVAPAA